MTTPDHQIEKIFGSLETAGFPRSLQDMVLPEWITPEVLSDEAASSEVAVILAKRLGLRTSPLFAENPRVELLRRRDGEIKYKRSIPNKPKNLTPATAIAVSVAEALASACRIEFSPFVGSASTVRAEVLNSFPSKWLV